ncbi:hypothetical protein [Burkholderia sp. JKS000303]|uniref:hypothetical protein n=1 Tax=Burkholderia sp. JKS000303 TaxID=1938747 RepID=UPI00211D7F80|nr:hypothetical protein [Burkholderia sp. JKS000303]
MRSLVARRKSRQLPAIHFQSRPIAIEPGIDRAHHSGWEVVILAASGDTVGTAIYSLAPRTDRVYIHRLDICPSMRRRGHGLTFLSYLHRTYPLPITAIDAPPDARSFWCAASAFRSGALRVTSGQSSDAFRDELIQWQYRQAEILGSRPPSSESSET